MSYDDEAFDNFSKLNGLRGVWTKLRLLTLPQIIGAVAVLAVVVGGVTSLYQLQSAPQAATGWLATGGTDVRVFAPQPAAIVLQRKEQGPVLQLEKSKILIKYMAQEPGQHIAVRTPHTNVVGRTSVFSVEVNWDHTIVTVQRGEVALVSKNGESIFAKSRQQVVATTAEMGQLYPEAEQYAFLDLVFPIPTAAAEVLPTKPEKKNKGKRRLKRRRGSRNIVASKSGLLPRKSSRAAVPSNSPWRAVNPTTAFTEFTPSPLQPTAATHPQAVPEENLGQPVLVQVAETLDSQPVATEPVEMAPDPEPLLAPEEISGAEAEAEAKAETEVKNRATPPLTEDQELLEFRRRYGPETFETPTTPRLNEGSDSGGVTDSYKNKKRKRSAEWTGPKPWQRPPDAARQPWEQPSQQQQPSSRPHNSATASGAGASTPKQPSVFVPPDSWNF